jgi:hypothetical protein
MAANASTTTGIVQIRSITGTVSIGTIITTSSNGVIYLAGQAVNNILLANNSSQVLDIKKGDNSGFAQAKVASISFANLGTIRTQSDGVYTIADNAETSFGRLQFGGTTSSFPALKRNGAAIDIRLADDSGYATLNANAVVANAASAFSAAVATPAGGSSAANITIGSASVGHYIGSGVPSVSAAKGSIYVNTTASTASTRLYINTDGATTWTAFTSAA